MDKRIMGTPESPHGLAPARTRVKLCGKLTVVLDGQTCQHDLPGRQGRMLFAYLVLNRHRPVTRAQLTESLWWHSLPQDPDAALNTALCRLRTALGPDVVTGRHELLLALGDSPWIDFEAARNAVSTARLATVESSWKAVCEHAHAAIRIAEEPLLPGLSAPWIDAARDGLEHLRAEALELLARGELERGGGDLATAERAGHLLVEQSNLGESGHLLLMEAQAARGNVAVALSTYEGLRVRLSAELGVAPSQPLRRLHERLLGADHHEPNSVAVVLSPPRGVEVPLPATLERAASAPLVGREDSRETLRAAFDRTRTGRRALVLVEGDPGIGKTRLVGAVANDCHTAGAIVLCGRADENAVVPYQPFLEAIRHYVIEAPKDAVAQDAGPAAELARLVPALSDRLGGFPNSAPMQPEAERYRLFEALASLLASISRRAPLVLVLDDLHWADAPTMLMLRHVARASESASILIVCAYRGMEVSEHVATALSDLRRDLAPTRVRLSGLSEQAVAALVAERANVPASPEFASTLHRYTRGNPFFVEEMLRHVAESVDGPGASDSELLMRIGVPEAVHEVIGHRLDRLSGDARRAVSLASVVGLEFSVEVVECLLDVSYDDLIDALHEAVTARIIEEAPAVPGAYCFVHALGRATLYERMTAGQRQRLHRQIAALLERMHVSNLEAALTDLAYHYEEAGPQCRDKAVEYAARARTRP